MQSKPQGENEFETANENSHFDKNEIELDNLKGEELQAEEPVKKSKEDFFDIPAFLRKKMGL